MLVVGSQALVDHGVKIGRKPSDLDFLATHEEMKSYMADKTARVLVNKPNKVAYRFMDGKVVEFEICDANPTGLWLLENYEGLGYPKSDSVHPEVVLAMKLSHRYLKNSPHFLKTMNDILAIRGLGYRVPEKLKGWLKDREKQTYHYAHPSLKRDKGKFFSGDGVDYKYEHDDIHEALATLPDPAFYPGAIFQPNLDNTWEYAKPAYTYFQKDPGVDVSVSKEKWLKCSEHVKLNSVLEEAYVLALERSQIPNDLGIAPRTSFLIALEKVCTSITSGWWREFAWEHYYQVLGMYSDDYVERFQKALNEGRIRAYQGAAA